MAHFGCGHPQLAQRPHQKSNFKKLDRRLLHRIGDVDSDDDETDSGLFSGTDRQTDSFFDEAVNCNLNRVKANFEAIIEKYSKEFPDSDDVDLSTMTVVEDQGHVRKLSQQVIGKTRLAASRRDISYFLDDFYDVVDNPADSILLKEDSDGDSEEEKISTESDWSDSDDKTTSSSDDECTGETLGDNSSVENVSWIYSSNTDGDSSNYCADSENVSETSEDDLTIIFEQSSPSVDKMSELDNCTYIVHSEDKYKDVYESPDINKQNRITPLEMHDIITSDRKQAAARLNFQPGFILSPLQLLEKMQLYTPQKLKPKRRSSQVSVEKKTLTSPKKSKFLSLSPKRSSCDKELKRLAPIIHRKFLTETARNGIVWPKKTNSPKQINRTEFHANSIKKSARKMLIPPSSTPSKKDVKPLDISSLSEINDSMFKSLLSEESSGIDDPLYSDDTDFESSEQYTTITSRSHLVKSLSGKRSKPLYSDETNFESSEQDTTVTSREHLVQSLVGRKSKPKSYRSTQRLISKVSDCTSVEESNYSCNTVSICQGPDLCNKTFCFDCV